MTRAEKPDMLDRDKALRLPAPLSILAAAPQIAALGEAPHAGWLGEAAFLPADVDAPPPWGELGESGLAVVEVDPNVPASMQRIREIRARLPALELVAAIESADVPLVRTLVREGVADVVALPLSPEEIFQAVVAIYETSEARSAAEVALAPVIAVTRALGGTGATTIASHLAAELAREGAKVCVFDLDLQFGRMAEVLGLNPRRTLTDLLEAGERLDGEFLHSVAAPHASGLSLVSAPREIVPIESVREKDMARILTLAQKRYDYVVLDLPANLTNWVLAILSRADSVVMTCQQTIASLQHTRRMLDLFGQLGLDTGRVSVVPNRVERRMFGGISMGDVETALRREVEVTLTLDTQGLEAAQDQGMLVGEVRRKSGFGSDIGKLAGAVLDNLAQERGR